MSIQDRKRMGTSAGFMIQDEGRPKGFRRGAVCPRDRMNYRDI